MALLPVRAGEIILADHVNTPANPWVPWIPTLTNLTLGSGLMVARYLVVGKTFDYFWKFVFGAGSSVSGTPRISLPPGITANPSYNSVHTDLVGYGTLLDFLTVNQNAVARISPGGNAIDIVAASGAGHTGITATSPWTWTTNDSMSVDGRFELA